MQQTLYSRVIEECTKYDSHFEAALDHLKMMHSHLFEEFEGRDMQGILTAIDELETKINNFIN